LRGRDLGALLGRLLLMAVQRDHVVAVETEDHARLHLAALTLSRAQRESKG
jgi:hypothetical protein